MDTLIKVLECWVPNRDRTCLEFAGGLVGDSVSFAGSGSSVLAGDAAELPGAAWTAAQPIVVPTFEATELAPGQSALVGKLTGAIAVPIYAGDFLTAVFIMLVGSDDRQCGAIELWRMTPGSWPDIVLVDGIYGNTDEAFVHATRRTAFRKGSGLPGRVWETGSPILVTDTDDPAQFVRAEWATRSGIKRALGLPCNAGRHNVCVLTLLSSAQSPLARRAEIWAPNGTHRRLIRIDGYCLETGKLGEASTEVSLERGDGAIGRAANTGIPTFSDCAIDDAAPLRAERAAAQLRSVAALPLIRDGTLYGVAALYF